MHRRAQLTLASLFVGFLFLVGVQIVVPFLPAGSKLRGVADEPPAPVWNLEHVLSGRAFRETEAWYDARVGLRNFWVRLDSELTYAVFGEALDHDSGTNVVVGVHDWLFESQYVKHAITPARREDARVKAALRHMKSVQDKLARRGIPFLLVVAPSKVEIYPEHVPPAAFGGRRPDEVTTAFELYRPELEAAGIHFLDGRRLFLDWKQQGTRYLFARGGTHWSYAASVRVLEEIRRRINPGMRHPLPPLQVGSEEMAPAQGTDIDLLNLLNLVTKFPFNHPQPRPVMVPQHAVPPDQLPRILWVHDSFGWPLFELLYEANAAQPTDSIYYFREFYHLPDNTLREANLKKTDWNAYLKDQDAVVMVWTEIAFNLFGWGFFETLDQQLR